MGKGFSQETKTLQKGIRQDHTHRLAITMDRHFGRGEVLDWCNQGLRILSCVPILEDVSYRVRFHIQKSQGLLENSRWLSHNGKVCWVQENENRWLVEIEFQQKIDKLDEYLAEAESCYLFFMSTDEIDANP